MAGDALSLLFRRADAAGIALEADLADRLLAYLDLLARWNRRINLTAFDLDHPSDAAIDRLLIEPLDVAAALRADAATAIDVGSGGGSPGIPIALAATRLEMTLVEARERKAAFLREAARTLAPDRIRVEARRFEDVPAATSLAGTLDVMTMRAVRADEGIWRAADALLGRDGEIYWLVDVPGGSIASPEGFAVTRRTRSALVLSRIV